MKSDREKVLENYPRAVARGVVRTAEGYLRRLPGEPERMTIILTKNENNPFKTWNMLAWGETEAEAWANAAMKMKITELRPELAST